MTDLHTSPPGQIYPGPPLPTPDYIRLLLLQPGSDDAIINCELVATELHSAQAYEALSYTWGDLSNYQVIHITIPGSRKRKEFSVTSNCFSALTRLRLKEQPRILWIDALCIDQANLSERNHQVTLMFKIYSQAADVVIYLGDATEDNDSSNRLHCGVRQPNLKDLISQLSEVWAITPSTQQLLPPTVVYKGMGYSGGHLIKQWNCRLRKKDPRLVCD